MKINDNIWILVRVLLLLLVFICFVLAVLDFEEEEKKGRQWGEKKGEKKLTFSFVYRFFL